MITKQQRSNAERIVELADTFGRLYINNFGQTPEKVLDLSVPCARLVVAGVVTGVDPDTNDGLNDAAVAELERYCVQGIEHAIDHGDPTSDFATGLIDKADELGLELPASLEVVALIARNSRDLVPAC